MLITKELADFLGLSPKTIVVYINNGRIEATKRGRDWFISTKEARRLKKEFIAKRAVDKRSLNVSEKRKKRENGEDGVVIERKIQTT